MLTLRRSSTWALAVAVATRGAAGAESGPVPHPSAEELDRQGTILLAERRLSEACPKLAASFRARPGTGVLLRLALCNELSGRLASAWHQYRDAAERARIKGDQAVMELAGRRASALEPRLPRLFLRFEPPLSDPSDVRVKCNGVSVASAQLASGIPLDGGPHRLDVSAPGRQTVSTVVPINTGAVRQEYVVRLARLAPARSGPDLGEKPSPTQPRLALVAAGVGVGATLLGSVAGLRVRAKMNEAESLCGSAGECPRRALELQDEARTSARLSNVAFALSGAALTSGLVLWLTAVKPERASRIPVSAHVASSAGRLTYGAELRW
jgi:hypothetical protein